MRPRPLCLEQLRLSAVGRRLREIQAAAGLSGAYNLAHRLSSGSGRAWGGQLLVRALAGSIPGSCPCWQHPWCQQCCGSAPGVWPGSALLGLHWLGDERGQGAGSECRREQRACPPVGAMKGMQQVLFLCHWCKHVSPFWCLKPTGHASKEQHPRWMLHVFDCRRTHAAAAVAAALAEGVAAVRVPECQRAALRNCLYHSFASCFPVLLLMPPDFLSC